MSIIDYFSKHYGETIKKLDQPLFRIENGGNEIYLPPELCLLDGVKDIPRADLARIRKNPDEKIQEI